MSSGLIGSEQPAISNVQDIEGAPFELENRHGIMDKKQTTMQSKPLEIKAVKCSTTHK
jgi:hypothetical protein